MEYESLDGEFNIETKKMNKEYNKRMKNTINKNKIFGNIFNKNENLEGVEG